MELNKNRMGQENPMEERTGMPGQGYQSGGRMTEQEFLQDDDPELTQVDLDENDLSVEEADNIEWEEPNRMGGEPNQ